MFLNPNDFETCLLGAALLFLSSVYAFLAMRAFWTGDFKQTEKIGPFCVTSTSERAGRSNSVLHRYYRENRDFRYVAYVCVGTGRLIYNSIPSADYIAGLLLINAIGRRITWLGQGVEPLSGRS
jgi:hypothetical protein